MGNLFNTVCCKDMTSPRVLIPTQELMRETMGNAAHKMVGISVALSGKPVGNAQFDALNLTNMGMAELVSFAWEDYDKELTAFGAEGDEERELEAMARRVKRELGDKLLTYGLALGELAKTCVPNKEAWANTVYPAFKQIRNARKAVLMFQRSLDPDFGPFPRGSDFVRQIRECVDSTEDYLHLAYDGDCPRHVGLSHLDGTYLKKQVTTEDPSVQTL